MYYPQMNNNYQMPMQNPYMERMAQLQQYQQSLQQPMQNIVSNQIPGANQQYTPMGKIIENVDVLKTTEVPMDGNIYYFPKADGSEIYSKQWLANGTTRIWTFKPVFEDNTNTLSSDTEKLKIGLSDEVTEVFMKRFDELEKRIDDLMPKKTTARAKKESEEE